MIGFKGNVPDYWAHYDDEAKPAPQPGIGLQMPGPNAAPGGQGMTAPQDFNWKPPEAPPIDPMMAMIMGGSILAGSGNRPNQPAPAPGRMPTAPPPESFAGIAQRYGLGQPIRARGLTSVPWGNFLMRPGDA